MYSPEITVSQFNNTTININSKNRTLKYYIVDYKYNF